MTSPIHRPFARLLPLSAALGAAAILAACVVQPLPPPRYSAPPQPVPVYDPPAYAPEDDAVVSVYVEPPLAQPEPVAVAWAPPPMLVEAPPPQPYAEAIWIGGFWTWEGRWIWAAGRWAPPPRPHYAWVQPYYEHRGEVVVFVPGFWCPPESHFMPPPPGLRISVAVAGPGLRGGRPPMGPQGVFVPPPPGSRHGIIVPAPVGTPPAVVVSAPPVVNVGMRVRGNVDVNSHNTTINDNRVTNITNVTNVTIEAPPGATANGQAYQGSVPARAHLAAALAPAGRPAAPRPVSAQPIPSFEPGRPPAALPPAQPVRSDRFDRGNPQNGGRPGQQAPQGLPQPVQAQQVQANQQPPAFQGHPGMLPPGQSAPGQQPNAQALPPQRVQPGQAPGQAQPPVPGQPQQPGQQAQGNPQDPRHGNQGGVQGNRPPGQPGQAQAGAQQGQAQAQGAQQGQQAQQPQAGQRRDGKEAKDGKEGKEGKDGHDRKAQRERKEDREKKDGERDR